MKLRRISLAVLSVLLSAIAALSGFMVYTQLSDRQKEKEEFDTLAEMVEVTPEKPNDETAVPTDDTSEPVRDLSGLFAQNSDCNGWLCIPDTQLSYPVMHTPDNPQKYLRRSFYGEYSQSGVPFLDWRCDLQSDHLIVYGHNMKNGTMFGNLTGYTDAYFAAEHPVIDLQTAAGLSRYTVFAVAAVQKTDPWYDFIEAGSSAGFDEQVADLLCKACYTTGVIPAYGQQLLTLSTCYGGGNGRLIVAAVKT